MFVQVVSQVQAAAAPPPQQQEQDRVRLGLPRTVFPVLAPLAPPVFQAPPSRPKTGMRPPTAASSGAAAAGGVEAEVAPHVLLPGLRDILLLFLILKLLFPAPPVFLPVYNVLACRVYYTFCRCLPAECIVPSVCR